MILDGEQANQAKAPSRSSAPQHYFAVDVLRGLAAVAVLFFHYQHFFYPDGVYHVDVRSLSQELPLHSLLFPLYRYGGSAVQVFWLISGFVFAHVYASRITSGKEFFIKRFARLYPLHFLTLVVVALLQIIANWTLGSSLIYEHNDLYHFALNLFFASYWGFEEGYSFNAPIWSVSVEIISYAFFWIVAHKLLRFGIVGPLLIAACAGLFMHAGIGPKMIWQCAMYFFVGCALYHIAGNYRNPKLALGAVIFACLAALATIAVFFELTIINGLLLFGVLLVASAALVDHIDRFQRFRHIRFIGDSTYGSYLWHVPIQITLMLIVKHTGVGIEIARSPLFLALFLFLACAAGWLSFVAFEKPANRRIVKWWRERDAALAQAAFRKT
ncbi:acyltransferase [Erythrobacter sp. SCSIO 43205]|uniref:acyltransferase family protein n=1 Tax=Erythrobacter sp. SCSIO 43205 TaxID=2779361 RepID=UPI001CA8D717|nr:acyltransferase [Erythrobacter sp. SCSIO 43205]UAB77786.1 acyltransferase [Erythrobacter sp. SCSIO 43205]